MANAIELRKQETPEEGGQGSGIILLWEFYYLILIPHTALASALHTWQSCNGEDISILIAVERGRF